MKRNPVHFTPDSLPKANATTRSACGLQRPLEDLSVEPRTASCKNCRRTQAWQHAMATRKPL